MKGARMAVKKPKRYQNISTMIVGVMRNTQTGPKSVTMKPGQIIALTEDEVLMSKDSYSVRDNNPFDRDIVAEVPEGENSHPNAPELHKNPRIKDVIRTFSEGTIDEAKALIGKIGDFQGINVCRRAISDLEEKVAESKLSDIGDVIEDRFGRIDNERKKSAKKYTIST